MDRLVTRVIVFCGLLAAAGAGWGWFLADTVGRGALLVIDESSRPGVWGIPIALALVIFTAWLACYAIVRDRWKAASCLHFLHFFVFPYLLSTLMVGVLSNPGRLVIELTMAAYVLFFTGAGFMGLRGMKKRDRTVEKPKAWTVLKPAIVPIIFLLLCTVALVASAEAIAPGRGSDLLTQLGTRGGSIALMVAWSIGLLASVDFGRSLLLSVVIGGLLGLWSGGILSASLKDEFLGSRTYVGAGGGLVFGALLAGMVQGALIVQIVTTHDHALSYSSVLVPVLLIWAACGGLVGLLVTGIVHGLTGERADRRKRVANGVVLAMIPILVASYCAFSYVQKKDVGRPLLARADELEGNARLVGLGAGGFDEQHPTGQPHWKNTIVELRSEGPRQAFQSMAYQKTISCCEDLLQRHPEGAYRGAASILKFRGETWEWQPREAIESWAEFRSDFPTEGYSWRSDPSLLAMDYSLLGDYEGVLRVGWSESGYRPGSAVLHAAEVLGKWDTYAEICAKNVATIKTEKGRFRRDKSDTDWWQRKLGFARTMKAQGKGAMTRTDVTGVVIVDGKPRAGVPVVIVPFDSKDEADKIQSSATVARLGGLLGTTDDRGMYHIAQAPVGKYEIVVVLRSNGLTFKKWQARVQGLPFEVKGTSTTAPRVELY